MAHKIIRFNKVAELEKRLLNDDSNLIENYTNGSVMFAQDDFIENKNIDDAKEGALVMPGENSNYDFENSKIIYEKFKNISETEATDPRFWAYLTHIDYGDYMRKRYRISRQPEDKQGRYIIEHWFLNGVSPSKLLRNGISLLWWGAHMTYDEKRNDPYELTKELFSMLDYTRTLIAGSLGRSKEITKAVLEHVVENKDKFKKSKERKIRHLIRKLNEIGGYKLLICLGSTEIKKILEGISQQLSTN